MGNCQPRDKNRSCFEQTFGNVLKSPEIILSDDLGDLNNIDIIDLASSDSDIFDLYDSDIEEEYISFDNTQRRQRCFSN